MKALLKMTVAALLLASASTIAAAAPSCSDAPETADQGLFGFWANRDGSSLQIFPDLRKDCIGLVRNSLDFGATFEAIRVCRLDTRRFIEIEKELFEYKLAGDSLSLANEQYDESETKVTFTRLKRTSLKP